jgi:hypothetical protein
LEKRGGGGFKKEESGGCDGGVGWEVIMYICGKIMKNSIPRILYKYCNKDGINILRNGALKFTKPHLFNDPFEGNPYIQKDLSQIELILFALTYLPMPKKYERREEEYYQKYLAGPDHQRLFKHVSNRSKLIINRSIGALCLTEKNTTY